MTLTLKRLHKGHDIVDYVKIIIDFVISWFLDFVNYFLIMTLTLLISLLSPPSW